VGLLERVMKQVYGDFDDPASDFPRPMSSLEAGPSPSGQRRYLWTDAFAVLNFVTLSHRAESDDRKVAFLKAADLLVEATVKCLGAPRSEEFPMLSNGKGGFKGMRIGKEKARAMSDDGMDFDGMYWHYLDKWIFALARLAQAKGELALDAVQLVKDVHPHFLSKDGKGLYWKMNVDLSVIEGLEYTGPNGDALSGWIVYNIVNQVNPVLDEEISQLRKVVEKYAQGGFRVSSDPLGFGLTYWELQWLSGKVVEKTSEKLKNVASSAFSVSRCGLPFRLYGAIIGGKLSGDQTVVQMAAKALDKMREIEMKSGMGDSLASINKVMFATALDPWAFQRQPRESLLPV